MSITTLCNQSLARIGAKRINNFDSDKTVEAIECRTHYEQTKDSLIRSHWWRFATERASLSEDTVSPEFGFDNQFILPTDFERLKNVYSSGDRWPTYLSYSIEGDRILTNESAIDITYIKKVDDTAKFDSLFTEVLILRLAINLTMPLSQDKRLMQLLMEELRPLMAQVRTIDRQETNTVGRANRNTWNDSRNVNVATGRIDSRLGS
jgi:hypothetical protein